MAKKATKTPKPPKEKPKPIGHNMTIVETEVLSRMMEKATEAKKNAKESLAVGYHTFDFSVRVKGNVVRDPAEKVHPTFPADKTYRAALVIHAMTRDEPEKFLDRFLADGGPMAFAAYKGIDELPEDSKKEGVRLLKYLVEREKGLKEEWQSLSTLVPRAGKTHVKGEILELQRHVSDEELEAAALSTDDFSDFETDEACEAVDDFEE